MKREIYIALFAILGFLVHFLIFESIATLYIGHSQKDFPNLVYQFVAPAWLALGVLSGFLQGRFFWQKIYVEKIRKETVFKWFSNKR